MATPRARAASTLLKVTMSTLASDIMHPNTLTGVGVVANPRGIEDCYHGARRRQSKLCARQAVAPWLAHVAVRPSHLALVLTPFGQTVHFYPVRSSHRLE
eukprot:6337227-Amphidinium_carterae.1